MDHDVYRRAAAYRSGSGVSARTIRQGIARQSPRLQRPPGIRNYDITDPAKPNLLQEFNNRRESNGTHHNFTTAGNTPTSIAVGTINCVWKNHQRPYSNALMIVDMSDPANVKEVSRWWVPGQKLGEEEEYKKYIFAGDRTSWTGNHGAITVPKRVEDGGTVATAALGPSGFMSWICPTSSIPSLTVIRSTNSMPSA